MNVSVIIPARNAAETVAETLESLRAQTFLDWEAIVVDDGSSDATAAIVTRFAIQDSRIRMVYHPHQGVSSARNIGIHQARFDWLLFLDADDWLSPLHLERLTCELAANANLDAVHCGWTHVTPDGTLYENEFCRQSGDLFDAFACICVIAIHTCVVRRSLVEAVGGFDTSLKTCEDWDLWQRIARTGARFSAVREVLAFYRMRPTSASVDGRQFLADSLRVIIRGHAPDPRVPNPHPAYATGRSVEHIAGAKLFIACWAAGLVLGSGEDALPLLDTLQGEHDPELDPRRIAECIFKAALFPSCRLPAAWIELWPHIEQRLSKFLAALEERSLAPMIAHRTRTQLERMILEHATAPRPLTLGTTYAIQVEITEPIPNISPPTEADYLQCIIECEEKCLGTLNLPICDGFVPYAVLADAIAAEFAWSILGKFFERTIYRHLTIERTSDGVSLRRGTLLLAEKIVEDERTFWSAVHDRVGWAVFLQEIWGRPDWPQERFYEPQGAKEKTARRYANDGRFVVEVSEDLPDVKSSNVELTVVLTVGGVALGIVLVPVKGNIVRAQGLRAALTAASGLELCRAVIRESLLGRPFTEPVSLRVRLAAAVSQRVGNGLPPERAADPMLTESGRVIPSSLMPGAERALHRVLSFAERSLVLGRREPHTMGTSASRWAMLPAAVARDLLETASVTGEPVLQFPGASDVPERTMYAPDLILDPVARPQVSPNPVSKSREVRSGSPVDDRRHHFVTLFATQQDPWKYTSPYEQTKYEQTLELLPTAPITRALELACAEGHFTAQLAPRVGGLLATDISQIALERAAERCVELKNVAFLQLDFIMNPLPSCFDLIVCSEVLYYCGSLPVLQVVARKLADALEPDGYLLTAHANLVIDEPGRPGFDWDCPFGAKVIGEVFAYTHPLRLVRELRTPLYRIQLFLRERHGWYSFWRRNPVVIEFTQQPAPLPPEVAAHVLWQGGVPRRNGTVQAVGTDSLPILMYHRVAPTGSPATRAYRVTLEAFEEQLRYLSDAGYYSIGLEEWRIAMMKRKGPSGRAILITFDDGYRDFLTYAWPLLKRYEFSATVFLVANEIGKSNHWDRVYGEEVPLLGWGEIRQLQSEGIEFGSHSATHRPLTGLSITDVVCEGVRSRAILERELQTPIRAFAYPYGDVDQVVQHLIGACGYVFGLSCRSGLSSFQDPLLALPRIEVSGLDHLPDFVVRLNR